MKTITIIPARGGSKGIPRKILAHLAGRPLIAHTIEAAKAAKAATRIIVSTDDAEIAAVARELGAEVPFLRPVELASDTTPMIDVIRHALDWFAQQGESYDAILLLQPTSPLRTARHIDEAMALFFEQKPTSVVSVVEVPHQYNPVSVMTLENGLLNTFLRDTPKATRRQDKPAVYARNGPAILICSATTLQSGNLYGDTSLPYLMPPEVSLDIDTPADHAYAQWLMEDTHAKHH